MRNVRGKVSVCKGSEGLAMGVAAGWFGPTKLESSTRCSGHPSSRGRVSLGLILLNIGNNYQG